MNTSRLGIKIQNFCYYTTRGLLQILLSVTHKLYTAVMVIIAMLAN
jgi:hypothetical protein